MTKPYVVEFTEEEYDAMTKEADALCHQFMALVRGSFLAHNDHHGAGVWKIMVAKLLIDWMEPLHGDNEEETRRYQKKELTEICGSVLLTLAKIRATAASNDNH